MPYQEFRKLFEQRPEPSRWQRITLGSSIKWALAGGLFIIALLLARGTVFFHLRFVCNASKLTPGFSLRVFVEATAVTSADLSPLNTNFPVGRKIKSKVE